MKKILLTQGQFAIVDDEDFDELSKFKWFADYAKGIKTFYAGRNVPLGSYKQGKLKMHRVILKAKTGQIVDHINHDTLDNRKQNLRITTKLGNNQNAKKRKDNSSGYKGVTWYEPNQKFVAKIRVMGKLIHLGYHTSPVVLAQKYNRAAQIYHKEFALLNKI